MLGAEMTVMLNTLSLPIWKHEKLHRSHDTWRTVQFIPAHQKLPKINASLENLS